MVLSNLLENLGNTPVVRLHVPNLPQINLFAKLESYNPTGSVKDRAAHYIIRNCLANGVFNRDTRLLESSSGNFGVALSAFANYFGLRFACVVDPNISEANEFLMQSYQASIIKVTEPDEFGGYLLTRIKTVKEILASDPNIYWVNQYNNPLNAQAYYDTIGAEICRDFEELDYVFMGVSSGGTITGVSKRLKHRFPAVKVIAVDSSGSVVFGGAPKKRHIPGIGSSLRPPILKHALIDDVVIVEEYDAARMCHRILKEYFLWVGGSSGSVFSAIHQYFGRHKPLRELNVLAVFPDKGEKYMNTIFNKGWCDKTWQRQNVEQEEPVPY
jgi:2,3-diaminopropionate biosynthesis protein SbnA